MTAPILAAAFFLIATTGAHVASIAIAALRLRRSVPGERLSFEKFPPVSLVRPLCGIDNYATDTLRSTFGLDYPRCEILFCVASAKDPVIPLIKTLMAEQPAADAKLLVGDERVSNNPKLNNVLKGWRAAKHDWIVLADSNVLMPRDYIERLFASWRADTGLVASPPIGSQPDGPWAELECAFLNTYQARWQYIADAFGFGFAQGKTMLWRRADLERAGGIELWPRRSPKMPRRPKWCAAPGSRCSWSIGRSRNRSVTAPPPRSGTGRCAGRGCAVRASLLIFCPRPCPAACCR